MGKKFNKILSAMLALLISSGSVITVAADAVNVNDPNEELEPYTFKWTEETQTDEFEVKSDVLGEADAETLLKEKENTDAKAEEESFSQEREKQDNDDTQNNPPEPVQAEKVMPEKSGAVNNTAAAGDTESESGTVGNLTWKYDGDTKTLTISGKGDMDSYSSYYYGAAPWKNKGIENVVIEKGVTSIGDYAFYDCTGLTSITIPDSVTYIGDSAFKRCTGITSIAIPYSVTSIKDFTFYGCKELTSITIPNSVASIGNYAFYDCKGLKMLLFTL